MYSVSQISSRWESKGYFAAARYFLLAIKIFYDIMLEYKISASVAQLDRALALRRQVPGVRIPSGAPNPQTHQRLGVLL